MYTPDFKRQENKNDFFSTWEMYTLRFWLDCDRNQAES